MPHNTSDDDAGSDYPNATFNYFKWGPLFEKEKPFEILMDIPDSATDTRQTNLQFEPSKHIHRVRSVRSNVHGFELDTHGFAFRKHATKFCDWHNKDAVEEQYIPEMERFLQRNLPDATRVVAYNWRIRNSSKELPKVIDLGDPTLPLHVATQPHVDCSNYGGIVMLKHHLPQEATELLKRRFRIINLWRPIKRVQNWPLAVCDGRTVDPSHLVAADRVRRDFASESLWAVESAQHDWYYMPDQDTDEVTMIKIADTSDAAETIRRLLLLDEETRSLHILTKYKDCLHAAFKVEDAAVENRESIEMRVFVFS
ncbi:hypothetical protein NX059_004641 [Plenodomus lindquistii]|nr:hypothetical protein NX059_004641 [Plenodomus lindquistii]